MKTTKWTNGLCALAIGASVLGTAMPAMAAEVQAPASEITEQQGGALNGTGEHKYDVRRGAYEQNGGSDIKVSRGRYEQPEQKADEKTPEHKISDKKNHEDKHRDITAEDKHSTEKSHEVKHPEDKKHEAKAPEAAAPKFQPPDAKNPDVKHPEPEHNEIRRPAPKDTDNNKKPLHEAHPGINTDTPNRTPEPLTDK